MKSKSIKIIPLLVVLVAFGLWLNKTVNFFQVEQKNDRIAISNSVVGTLNRIQEKMEGPKSLFEQFIRIDELDASQKRGTWALLDLMTYEHGDDIDQAQAEIKAIFEGAEEEDKALKAPALALIESYRGYDAIYVDIADKIKSKSLTAYELQSYLAGQYQKLVEMSDAAYSEFETIQYSYIKG